MLSSGGEGGTQRAHGNDKRHRNIVICTVKALGSHSTNEGMNQRINEWMDGSINQSSMNE